MKILYLPLEAQYYEMIERGEKREEYRETSAYWIARLCEWRSIQGSSEVVDNGLTLYIIATRVTIAEARMIIDGSIERAGRCLALKHYDAVCFSYGYTRRRMTFECRGITGGIGLPEWGAPDHETFIIKLGRRIQ